MSAKPTTEARAHKLMVRLGFLERDPANRLLLMETADLALGAGEPDVALDLIGRAARVADLSSEERNLMGIAAIKANRFDLAAECFKAVLTDAGDPEPGPKFNLAWSLAVLERSDDALVHLDDHTTHILPQAATLKVQLLHKLGLFEEALAEAQHQMESHPDHAPLMGVTSVLALDCEDAELAADLAKRAGDQPDALSTLGTLVLGEEDASTARAIFERALNIRSDIPRAWVGLGLAKLLANEPLDAARDIERGAQLFVDHLGSWIAAGWARLVAKDYLEARRCFEHALTLDPTFSEAQGSLAVMDIFEGRLDLAREKAKIALRLDRNSFSGAFAHSLLAAADGDQARARLVLEQAASIPIGKDGKTIGQILARMSLRTNGPASQ